MLELAAIIVFGIFAQWIAWRMRIPAIFPLIILGLFLGPFPLFFWINNGLIQKIFLLVKQCIILYHYL